MAEYVEKDDAIRELEKEPVFSDAWNALREARDRIRKLPPADVVPVIHTEWERHMSFGICRNCGYEYDWKATDARNYCPNCGAKADGERKVVGHD